MFILNDLQCLHNEGILHKYARTTDGALFSVKPLIIPENSKPESHPVIQTLEKLAVHSHPSLPKYFGYTTKKGEGFTEILVFFEDSEGVLSEYISQKSLSKEELNNLVSELIDVFIFIDRNAYVLPSYITPYSILVSKDNHGKTHFKPFGFLPHDDNRKASDEDLKFMAPELYERNKLKRTHVIINAEKSLFYSIGILALFCDTKELISDGRDSIEQSTFTSKNQERESQASAYARTKLMSKHHDQKLDAILEKLLVYSEKERNDFRVWQLSQKDGQKGRKKSPPKVQKTSPPKKKEDKGPYANGRPLNAEQEKKLKKKSACCELF